MTRLVLYACLGATLAARPDRRIVDRVTIGDARSEQEHAFAGDGVVTGIVDGRAYRQAHGWMRVALTAFDDTEVTVACTFARMGDVSRAFDLYVENQRVGSFTFRPTSAAPRTVEVRVPIEVTRGRTNIQVTLRATNGLTPALLELRTVQDHNE